MYVCLCMGITDTQIRDAVIEKGITRMGELSRELGCCRQCGKCAQQAKRLLQESRSEIRPPVIALQPMAQPA